MADSDDEISAEDVSFFKKRARTASFLMRDHGMEPEERDKQQRKKDKERELVARKKERAALERLQGRMSDEDVGDEGPRRNRHWQDEEEKERKQGLPVKLADGSIKKVLRAEALPDPDTVEEQPAISKRAQKRARGERIAEKKALERGEVYVKPGAKPQAEEGPTESSSKDMANPSRVPEPERPLTHDEKKAAIADNCSKLMHNPEKNIGCIARLHKFCTDTDPAIVKMAALSEAMVFADILPDYRIRLPTEKEKEMKVSKEVAQQRAYESTLLGGYQRFLQFLEAAGRRAEEEAKTLWEDGQRDALQSCTLAIVVQAMALLQKRRPSFNFASNLLQSLARRVDSPVPAIADMALAALRETIESCVLSEHVKSCVSLLADVIKKRERRVNPQASTLNPKS
jgi:nucleolar complex protein 3